MTQTATVTRDSLVSLGRASKPWEFCPIMAQISFPPEADPELVFLHAANLGRLGVRELAQDRLAQLPAHVRSHESIAALDRALAGMPSSRIPLGESTAHLEANLAVLVGRGILSPESAGLLRESTLTRLASHDGGMYRCLDGNVILPGIAPTDFRSRSRELIQSETVADGVFPSPLVFDSIAPPWLLIDAHERWGPINLGFSRRLIAVHEDLDSLGLGLALADLTKELGSERLFLFAGSAAMTDLEAFLGARMDEMLAGRMISLRPDLPCREKILGVVQPLVDRQVKELAELKARAEAIYAPRDRAFWAARYAEAAAGKRVLRILVPTTRYSTVLQHSAADLVDSFNASGHQARLLIEADASASLSANAYWRTFAEFEPDMVVQINYPRSLRLSTTPTNVPWVTWLQDAMPHLFAPELGTQQGDLDFAAGYQFTDCYAVGTWPCKNSISSPVVVNSRKFHAAPVRGFDNLRCDVAFVSNHAETPEQLDARIRQTFKDDPASRNCIVELHELVVQAVSNAHQVAFWEEVGEAVGRLEMRWGFSGHGRTILNHHYVAPLAGQLFRHQALEWTREICDRRGWTFHLYGKGWSTHPTLARFAKGPVAHGEQLRAAYQLARVQLHLDMNTLVHQRVSECFLSGGLILARFFYNALDAEVLRIERAMVNVPPDGPAPGNRFYWDVNKHPQLIAHRAFTQKHRVPPRYPDGRWLIPQSNPQATIDLEPFDGANPLMVLGDLDHVTFRTKEDFESLLERAIDPGSDFRARTIADIQPRVKAYLTHDCLADRMINLIASRLNPAAHQPARAHS